MVRKEIGRTCADILSNISISKELERDGHRDDQGEDCVKPMKFRFYFR